MDAINKTAELRTQLDRAIQSNDAKKAIGLIEAAITDLPAIETTFGVEKFQALREKLGDDENALEYGNRLVREILRDNAAALNTLAWSIVDPKAPKPASRFISLALTAARQADELTQRGDPAIADTLAKAYFDTGDIASAIRTQERAIALARGTPLERDEGFKNRLDHYRKATSHR